VSNNISQMHKNNLLFGLLRPWFELLDDLGDQQAEVQLEVNTDCAATHENSLV